MRIVSKIKDYYDGVNRDFSKQSVQLIRTLTLIEGTAAQQGAHKSVTLGDLVWYHSKSDFTFNISLDYGVIGFCGKIYPYIEQHSYNSTDVKVFYTMEDFVKHCPSQTLINGVREDYFSSSNIPVDVFRQYKAAYFHVDYRNGLTLYPILRKYQFYKVFSAPSAYQEIEMYLGNVLHPRDNPHIDPVPDVIKAESHGFDKWSFRKMPGDKKRKAK